jgi:hypothetical protein
MTASTTVSWHVRASSLVALLALAVGVASCGSARSARTESRTSSTPPAPRMLVRPAPDQRGHFALLRTRPEGLPPSVRRLVHPGGAGVNPALAQRVPVVLPGRYWLLPGIGQLCLVSEVAGVQGVETVCGSTRQAIMEGIATISFPPVERASFNTLARLLVGVAPDGAQEALVYTRGSVAVVPVVQSVFVLRDLVRAPSDRIELRFG